MKKRKIRDRGSLGQNRCKCGALITWMVDRCKKCADKLKNTMGGW